MEQQPTVSGVYEYLTGGEKYTPVDVGAGDHIRSLWPSVSKWLTMIKGYLPKAAAYLKEQGVTHVVDFASGMPVNHIHNTLTDACVLYSDINPAVVAAAQEILSGQPNVKYVQADVRDPLALLDSAETKAFLGDIDKLAIGISGVAAFLHPDEYQRIAQTIYGWAPAGTILYSQFDGKEAGRMTPRFQEFMTLMEGNLGAYYLYSAEQCQQAVAPWHIDQFTSLIQFLEVENGHIQPEDHEDVGLNFYALLAHKPA